MDPVTHGLVGATCAQFFADKRTFRSISFVGFTSALLADADVFLGSASDPLLTLELHRQFTHSFAFIPFGALVSALLLWWLVKKHLSFKTTYLISLAGFATAGFMDVITSYGVQLLWPFSDQRFSLSIVSVFDPLFTLILLGLTGFAWYKRKKKVSIYATAWLLVYLSFGFFQQERVIQASERYLTTTSSSIDQLVVKPTIANQLLWSVRFKHDVEICTMGVRANLFSAPTIYAGNCLPAIQADVAFASIKGSVLYEDILRFSELSDDFLIYHPEYKQVIGDARYSMLPTRLSPLWGITVDTTQTNRHAEFGTYRTTDDSVRTAFKNMLWSR
jgi:inner membrane protein